MKRGFLLAVLLLLFYSMHASELSVTNLKVQNMVNPAIIDVSEPMFSWNISSDRRCVMQSSYRIVVSTDSDFGDIVWDSGIVDSDSCLCVKAAGIALRPATRYYWRVTVTDNANNEATSSELAWFDTGLMSSGWSGAQWIKATDFPAGTEIPDVEKVTEYTIEARFSIEHTAAGICFARKDNSNFYMWQFNVEGEFPRLRPHKWTNGNLACLDNIDLTGKVVLKTGSWYTVRVEVSDDCTMAKTYIDGVLVDERSGDFSYGLVGVRQDKGESDGAPEIASFDDFKVVTSSGKVLFEEDFSSDEYGFDGGEVMDGYLRVVGSTVNSVYAWQKDEHAFLKYTIEADMTLMKDNAAIVFSSTGARTYLMWQINTFDSDKPLLRHHIYNNSLHPQYDDVIIEQFSKDDILNHERRVKIDVEGKCIRTFIDGVLVDTYIDNSGVLAKGDIGFRVDNSAQFRDNVYFDNVLVTEYDENNTPTIVLDENFEQLPSAFFYDAIVVDVNGNHKMYMPVTGIETRVMQRGTKGAPMFRKEFSVSREIKSAKLYTSGLGVYDVFVNGARVGHIQPDGTVVYEELKPGRTDYHKRVHYSCHDITSLVHEGANAVGAVVTDGWWRGDVAHGEYGTPDLAFIALLRLTYEDGTVENVITDRSWLSFTGGAMRSGDIYNGEIYDARLEDRWTEAGYDQSDWNAVAQSDDFNGVVEAPNTPPVMVLEEHVFEPVKTTVYDGTLNENSDFGMINIVSETSSFAPLKLKKGQTVIFDFGQNFAGWVEFKARAASGNRLRMRFSEMLNDTGEKSRGNDGPGGSLYLLNLRSAKAELFYTFAGKENGETYRPTMTFFGFRYCEVSASDDVEIMYVSGQPISTRLETTGSITTSDDSVNRLFSNIQWSQRSNFISIPTDCPQRDERLGWTADVQIFSRTAAYNADVATFLANWMESMRDGQHSEGAYPNVSPYESWDGYGAGAWADAGIIVPWTMYQMYGDKSIIEDNYESMMRYMDWLSRQAGDGYKYQGGVPTFGDWLAFVPTDSRYVSVCYYAYDASLMAKMSKALSKSPDDRYARNAEMYEKLFDDIKAEFATRYLMNGMPRQQTQTTCLLALRFGLLPDAESEERVRKLLSRLISSEGERLNTGFVGTGIINTTLSEQGLIDKAYNLLLQRDCPSWLYSVDQGATTTWERWDSYRLDTGFGDYTMNSFNHYAYGAVGEWMYRYLGGIDTDENAPGFKHIVLRPSPDVRKEIPEGQERITWAKASYKSAYGVIRSEWKYEGDDLVCEVEIPANTIATLYFPLPFKDAVVYEGGVPAIQSEGVEFISSDDDKAVFRLGSGSYRFTCNVTSGISLSDEKERLIVYPNPVRDVVYVKSDIPVDGVTLYDMAGNMVIRNGSCDGCVDVSELLPGVYVLTVRLGEKKSAVKVVKVAY